MKYYITEHATYEVEAENPRLALERFKTELKAPFPTDVDYRDVCDEQGTDWTEEAEGSTCPECERSNGPHFTGVCEHGDDQ